MAALAIGHSSSPPGMTGIVPPHQVWRRWLAHLWSVMIHNAIQHSGPFSDRSVRNDRYGARIESPRPRCTKPLSAGGSLSTPKRERWRNASLVLLWLVQWRSLWPLSGAPATQRPIHYQSPPARLIYVHRATGSVVEGRRVGYDRSGQARMEDARKTITLGHREAGAGRTMSDRRGSHRRRIDWPSLWRVVDASHVRDGAVYSTAESRHNGWHQEEAANWGGLGPLPMPIVISAAVERKSPRKERWWVTLR